MQPAHLHTAGSSWSTFWIMTMKQGQPVFKLILGNQWNDLGEVIQKHYFLRSYSNDHICVTGVMGEINHSFLAKLLIPFGMLFGALVPYKGKDIPIEVNYHTKNVNGNIYWDRVFMFPGKRPYHFRSFMQPAKNNDVVEYVRFGVGMRLKVTAEQGSLVFRNNGYIWRVANICIPIPLHLIIGTAYIEECPIDSTRFSMKMELKHPLFGTLFQYRGKFRLPVHP